MSVLDSKASSAPGSDVASGIEALVASFVPPGKPADPVTPAAVETADLVARRWTSTEPGALRPGSAAHKRAICAMFHETFNPYRPSVIAWPALGPEELRRLQSLPIWDIAVQTEGRARLSFAAYAESLADSEMRSAIMLNAWEENRHKEVLSKLVEAYGIALEAEPPYSPSRDLEFSYLVTGYSESIDSFFAFGLFDLAQRTGFFPMELVETFEPVIQEECRHILFFANWLAWYRANLPWHRRAWFELRVAAVWVYIGWLRIGLARSMDKGAAAQDKNFTVNGAQAVTPVEIGLRDLIQLCLTENERRFAGYDARLVRPTAIPTIARFALHVSKLWTRQKR